MSWSTVTSMGIFLEDIFEENLVCYALGGMVSLAAKLSQLVLRD